MKQLIETVLPTLQALLAQPTALFLSVSFTALCLIKSYGAKASRSYHRNSNKIIHSLSKEHNMDADLETEMRIKQNNIEIQYYERRIHLYLAFAGVSATIALGILIVL